MIADDINKRKDKGVCKNMNFGQALEVIKDGTRKVARQGWNAKNMWIAYWKPGSYGVDSVLFDNCPAVLNYIGTQIKSKTADVEGTIIMKNAQGMLVFGWLASQSDMMANDWNLVC